MRIVNFKNGLIWLDGIPDTIRIYDGGNVMTKYPVIRTIESHVESVAADTHNSISAALQIWWAIGGQGNWAFLGAAFEPHTDSSCIVRVAISADNPGLIPELGQAVVTQATKFITEGKFPLTGIIRFERAVSHPFDSSPRLFRMVTECLMQLLISNHDVLPDEAITEIVAKARRELHS